MKAAKSKLVHRTMTLLLKFYLFLLASTIGVKRWHVQERRRIVFMI